MPTYEYRCSKCSHSFEHFQSMTSPNLSICPKCNHHSLERIIGGGAGLMFKGSGFYITDYKKSNSSSTDTKSTGGKKPESKPADPPSKNNPPKTEKNNPSDK